MPNTQQAIDSDSRFGSPSNKRKEYFKQCLEGNASKFSVEHKFQGRTQTFPVVPVPIEMPKYRLSNGRTASLQQEHLAQHPELPKDFFRADPELLNVQEVQHELLLLVVEQEDLLKTFSDPAIDQTDPIILDCIFENVNLIKCVITIVFNPEYNIAKQFIMLQQFNIIKRVNFFAPADYFICTVIVYMFYDMR